MQITNEIISFFKKILRLIFYVFKGKFAFAFSQFDFTTYLRRILLHIYFSSNKIKNKKAALFDLSYATDRYAFNLLNTYKLADYDIYLKPNYKFYVDSKGLYFDEIFTFLNVRFYYNKKQLEKYTSKHLAYDFNTGEKTKIDFDKRIYLKQEGAIRSQELKFPFGFHPNIYRTLNIKNAKDLKNTLATSKNIYRSSYKIFFAGATEAHDYYEIKKKFPSIIDRNSIFEHIKANFSEVLGHKPFAKNLKPILILDSEKDALNSEQLFTFLKNSDFLIAPPGFEMPFCHNVIEAMACGVIPIIQYAAYWYPNLVHGENCLQFNTLDELDDCIEMALYMDERLYSNLKQNVSKYFNEFLLPEGFVNRINSMEENNFHIRYISGVKI